MSDAEKVALLIAAIKEIKFRLTSGDSESSISICSACEIAMNHGIESSEIQTYRALEKARLS